MAHFMGQNAGDILNRFTNLQTTITQLLMEAAMKMSASSDMNLFILIDSSSGRRFGGHPSLCDAYLSGSLVPGSREGEELYLELTKQSCDLKETMLVPPSMPSSSADRYSHADLPFNLPLVPHSSKGVSKKKRKRSGSSLSQENCKKEKHSSSSSYNSYGSVTPYGSGSPSNFNVLNDFDSKDKVYLLDDSSENEALNPSFEYDDSFNEVNVDDFMASSSANQVALMADDVITASPSCFTGSPPGNLQDYDDFGIEINFVLDYLNSCPKAAALKEADDSDFYDKDSGHMKLLRSLVYTIGKVISANCPFSYSDKSLPVCKQFYARCFDLFWSFFPGLHRANEKHGTNFHMGKQAVQLKTMIRSSMQSYFVKELSKKGQSLITI